MRHYVTGTVTAIERLGATYWGNPMLRVWIDGKPFRLANGAQLAYGIANPEYRELVHTFELSPAGRLTGRVYDPVITWRTPAGLWGAEVPRTVGDDKARRLIARRAIADAAGRTVGRVIQLNDMTYKEV